MVKIKTYRDLIVWQKSMSFVKKIYTSSNNFPEAEKFGICSQIRRSSISIPSNIAEGYGRNSTKDYVRFLNIACGSLYETQTLIELSYNLEFINEECYNVLYNDSRELERMLSSLTRKLKT